MPGSIQFAADALMFTFPPPGHRRHCGSGSLLHLGQRQNHHVLAVRQNARQVQRIPSRPAPRTLPQPLSHPARERIPQARTRRAQGPNRHHDLMVARAPEAGQAKPPRRQPPRLLKLQSPKKKNGQEACPGRHGTTAKAVTPTKHGKTHAPGASPQRLRLFGKRHPDLRSSRRPQQHAT